MCGYGVDSALGTKVKKGQLLSQLQIVFNYIAVLHPKMTAITPIGSFFDSKEFPSSLRRMLLKKLQRLSYPKVFQVESRPEYILKADAEGEMDLIDKLLGQKTVIVGIGLETSSDFIRQFCINKGFNGDVFTKACEILHEHNLLVKAYLLLKPPFLSEGEALQDCLSSVSFAFSHGADLVDVSPCRVYPYTLCSLLFEKKTYRPPWLWTTLELLRKLPEDIAKNVSISTWGIPPYSDNLPYNCARCSEKVNWYLRLWRLSKDPLLLKEARDISCQCKTDWEKNINARLPPLDERIKIYYQRLKEDLRL